MGIWILFLSVIVLMMFAFFLNEGYFFSPSVIACIGFVLCTLSAIYNAERWQINLHINTYFVIVIGLLTFILAGKVADYLLKKLYEKGKVNSEYGISESSNIDYWKIENWKINSLIGLTLIFICLYISEVNRIVNHYKGNLPWTEKMLAFRHLVSYGVGTLNVNPWIEQGFQVLNFLGYVYIYILVRNYVVAHKINIRLLFLTLIVLCGSFVTSARLEMMQYPIAAITIYVILMNQKDRRNLKNQYRLIMKCVGLFLILCILFVVLKNVAGRIDKRTPFYYITFYLGQSIPNLDIFLQEKMSKSFIWGKETFYGLNHLKYLLTKNVKFNYIGHKEFHYVNGESIGNVYTVFRAYIHDFGYGGMLLLTIIQSFIINFMYSFQKKKKGISKKMSYGLLFLAYLMYSIYFMFYADYFYNNILAIRPIKLLIIFKFGELYLLKLKVKMKGGCVRNKRCENF